MSAELTPYEFQVLRSHWPNPRRESELHARQAAQKKLSRLGYLRMEGGVYKVTPEGRQVIEAAR